MLLLFNSIIVPTTENKSNFIYMIMTLNVQLLQKKIFETFSKCLPSSTNLETLAEQIIQARPTRMVSKYYPQHWVWNCNFGDCLDIVFVVYHRLSVRLVNTNQTHLVRTFFTNRIGRIVSKHLTGGFPFAVMDLSGNL